VGAQIILEHPVVSGRSGVADSPDRGQIGYLDVQALGAQSLIELRGTAVPQRIEAAVARLHRLALEAVQKLVHRAHDIRVGVEGAAREADVDRMVLAKPAHQLATAAHDADRKTAGHGLAVGHQIRPDTKVFLRAPLREPEADEHLVENECNAALGAHRPQLLEPFGVGAAIEMCLPRAVDERGV